MPLSFWLMLVSVGEVFYPTTLLKKIVSILVVNGFLLEFLPPVLDCRSSNGSLNLETLCFIHTFRHVLHVYDILFYDYKKDFMICIRVVFFQMGLFRPISIGCLQDANNSLEFISKPYRMGTAHCLFFLRERLF